MSDDEDITRLVRQNDHVTSIAAALRAAPKLSQKKRYVLQLLQAAGARGLADFEIRRLSPSGPESTYRKRRTDLVEHGFVVWNGQVRRNLNDCDEKVWVLRSGQMEMF